MKLYKAYVFTGQDPVVAEIAALAKGSGTNAADIAAAGGPTAQTVRNWLNGKTKRPQNATIEAAGRAMGFHREWQPLTSNARAGGVSPKRRRKG